MSDCTHKKIVCPEHGSFFQEPANHVSNHGCPYCGGRKIWPKEHLEREASLFYSEDVKIKN